MPGLNNHQQHPRRIHPLTAIGVLLILIAATALITYTLLTVPSKIAAQAGPPEAFREAATRQAGQVTATHSEKDKGDAEDSTTITPSSTMPVQPTRAITPTLPPTDTPNPYGEWPLPNWVEERYWLSIPQIGVEAPIIALAPRQHDVEGQMVFRLPVPNSYAASWDETSAQPGFAGNTILTGHSNLYGGVFQDLDELTAGAEIAVWSELGVFSYYVTNIVYLEENGQPIAVRRQNAQWLNDSADDRITLITCWPNSDSSHRLIIVGVH